MIQTCLYHNSMGPSPAKRTLHYAWIVAAITFCTLLIGAGVRATPSVLIVPLERDFHWSRATISFAISVNLVLYGLIGPFAAELMNRFGVRRVIAGSLLVVSTAVALTTRMTASWQLVMLWGVLVGCGTGMTALVLGATIVNRWFSAQRGVVMGVLTASTATGQLIFLPILAALVERNGWRSAALLIAGCAAAIIPFALLLIRERPTDLGLLPYGEDSNPDSKSHVSPARESALAVLRSVAPSRDFWLLFASFFICGVSTNGLIGTHLIPACMDHGIPEVKAAGLLAIMGIFDLIGTTSSGWLSDRFDNRYLLAWYYGLRGLSLLYLPFSFDINFYGLSLFAVFYGLDWIATVPPTVRLTANLFGKERSSIVFGWIVAGHQLGAALAAFGAGAIRTYLGNYTSAFLLAGLMCVTATLVVLPIGRRPKTKPQQPLPVLASAE
jgi:sugar phosphate permease